MKHIVQVQISKGDQYYIAEGVNLPVVTQAKTLDELVKNVTEAVTLQLELDKGTTQAVYRQAMRYVSEEELRPHFYTE